MKMKTSKLLAAVLRWTARIVGTSVTLYVAYCMVGEGMKNSFHEPIKEMIGDFGEIIMMIAILLGWRWELSGGVFYLIGWGMMCLPPAIASLGVTWYPKSLYGLFFALSLPGIFYVTSAILRRSQFKRAAA
jgi:hypothetical protein